MIEVKTFHGTICDEGRPTCTCMFRITLRTKHFDNLYVFLMILYIKFSLDIYRSQLKGDRVH